MGPTEKVVLLGKGLYKDIPDELTINPLPTISELDMVGAEDFDDIMIKKILPQVVVERIDPSNLLEIDYYWLLRCLRFLSFGYYVTVGAIFCEDCGSTSRGEYQVDLRTVECRPLPPGFENSITISKDEFIDFNKDIEIHLPTIQEKINSRKDKQFQDAMGRVNRNLANICYKITSIDGKKQDPVSTRLLIQSEMSRADYEILIARSNELDQYGLRSGGKCKCPACGSDNGAFITFIDESFFRPDLASLRRWKYDRDQERERSGNGKKDVSGAKAK